MNILVACEESQAVCIEMRKRGHQAYSCDILPSSGGYPEWHIQGDVLEVLDGGLFNTERGNQIAINGWDMMIAHPPCTYLSVSGARWLYNKDGSKNVERWQKRDDALTFVKKLMDCDIDKKAIENPVSMISSQIRKADQVIQPYMFGDTVVKTTCLWLDGLPKLEPTNIVKPEYVKSGSGRVWSKWFWETSLVPYKDRSTARSKTFPGIAKAFAEQWA